MEFAKCKSRYTVVPSRYIQLIVSLNPYRATILRWNYLALQDFILPLNFPISYSWLYNGTIQNYLIENDNKSIIFVLVKKFQYIHEIRFFKNLKLHASILYMLPLFLKNKPLETLRHYRSNTIPLPVKSKAGISWLANLTKITGEERPYSLDRSIVSSRPSKSSLPFSTRPRNFDPD